jgi:hypothetical protein
VAAAPGQAIEVTVRAGTKLSQIRKGVRELLGRRAHSHAKPRTKGRPVVPLAPQASKQPASPPKKKGSSFLERMAQGKLPTK